MFVKKAVCAILCLLLMFASCADIVINDNSEFLIEAITSDIPDSTKINLIDGYTNVVIDSSYIIGNKFRFSGTLSRSPQRVLLMIPSLRDYRYVWIDEGATSIDARSSKLRRASIVGSSTQELNDVLSEKIDGLHDPEDRKNAYWSFIHSHPDENLSGFLLTLYKSNFGVDTTRELYARLTKRIRNDIYGSEIREFMLHNRDIKPGDSFADLDARDTSGEYKKLSDHLGRATLVEFWASWCMPCRRQNPELRRTYQKYHGEGFNIYAVSLDADSTRWVKAIRQDSLNWINVSDLVGEQGRSALTYGVSSLPDNFLIDARGVIVGRGLKGQELDAELNRLLLID